MHLITTYDPTTEFSPMDPRQRVRDVYVQGSPGGYQAFAWNRVATDSQLSGLGLSWAGLPVWAQVAIVGAGAVATGYFGMSRFGSSHIKPALRKVGINLAGPRTRRRRR